MALDTNTKLLLHMDTDTIDDSSPSNHGSATLVGSAHRDTSITKFGAASWNTGSLALDGDSDWITFPASTDWNFGTNDFTIDLWAYLNDNTFAHFFEQATGHVNPSVNFYIDTGTIYYHDYTTGSNLFFSAGAAPSTGVWHHYALVRSGTTWYVFIDGVERVKTLLGGAYANPTTNINDIIYIGVGAVGPWSYFLNGYVDEYRITNGTARWTSNFTPYCGLNDGKAYGHSPTPCFQMRHLGAGTV